MISKNCTRCKVDKEISLFPNQAKGKNGKASECQKCYSERLKVWKLNNYEKLKGYKWKFNFNLTVDDYNNLFEKQNGTCAICKRHQTEFKRRFAVDHCHKTGMIRGLLCGNCNTALGLLKEDEKIINNVLAYIEENKFDRK